MRRARDKTARAEHTPGTASAVAAALLQQVVIRLGLWMSPETPFLGRPPSAPSRRGHAEPLPPGEARAGPRADTRRRGRESTQRAGRRPPGLEPQAAQLAKRTPRASATERPLQGYLRRRATPGPKPGFDPNRSSIERWVCSVADDAPGSPRDELFSKWEEWGRGTRGATDHPSEPSPDRPRTARV